MKNEDIQGMFEQLLDGQNKLTGNLNGKIDSLYNDFNAKFEAMDIRMKKLDTQVAQTAEAMKRQTNQLPGRTEQNPREHCNAIMTWSGRGRPTTIAVDPVTKDLVEIEEVDEDEEDAEDAENSEIFVSQKPLSIDNTVPVDRQSPSHVLNQKSQRRLSIDTDLSVDRQDTKENPQRRSSIDNTIHVDRQDDTQNSQRRPSIDNTINVDRQEGTQTNSQKRASIDNTIHVDRQGSLNSNSQKHVSIDTTSHVDRQGDGKAAKQKNSEISAPDHGYTPRIPYPKTLKRSKQEIEDERCKLILDQLSVRIPYFKECKMAPPLRKIVDKMVSNVIAWEEGVAMITDTCTKMIKKKLPKKMEDPGSFVLSCMIGERVFEHSLCDSGSSVNVVPLSVAKGWGKLEPSNMMLTLADRSIRQAAGILEDVLVKVDECWIPTDFVVLEYDEEPKDPIILGRPFLATARAMIDFAHSKVHLHLGNKVMHFNMDRKEKATIDGQTFQVNTIQESAVGVKEVIESRGEMHKSISQPKSTKASTEQSTVVKQKAPDITLLSSPQKQRCTGPSPTSKSAGKHSPPPKQRAHPGDVPRFLGRSHAPTAYTPPWMRRMAKKHSMPLSDPPDA